MSLTDMWTYWSSNVIISSRDVVFGDPSSTWSNQADELMAKGPVFDATDRKEIDLMVQSTKFTSHPKYWNILKTVHSPIHAD